MTHNDIYIKFMIEYDKANIATSFPSLTEYEIATVLDKAYLALIAQKLTGNNTRRSAFESDTKTIEDLRPLIKTTLATKKDSTSSYVLKGVQNAIEYTLPEDLLYYISSTVQLVNNISSDDTYIQRILPVQLISHQLASKFFVTSINMPWIKTPVSYIEGTSIVLLYDLYKTQKSTSTDKLLYITYILKPNKFTNNLINSTTQFELSDTMVEELINLAITMSLEIVESTRLGAKLQTKQLES